MLIPTIIRLEALRATELTSWRGGRPWAAHVEAESSLFCGHKQLTVFKWRRLACLCARHLEVGQCSSPLLQILCSTSVSMKLAFKICLLFLKLSSSWLPLLLWGGGTVQGVLLQHGPFCHPQRKHGQSFSSLFSPLLQRMGYKGTFREKENFSRLNFFFLLHQTAGEILAPWPGIEPTSHALEAQSLNHGTPGKVPEKIFILK